MNASTRPGVLKRVALGACCLGILVATPVVADEDDARWLDLKAFLYADREIQDGSDVIDLDAPYRAHDAAIVPIVITAKIAQTPERYIRRISLLIDNNPSPMAGVFELTPRSGNATIATRVRINEYTNVRAIAETNDGELYMTTRFVKASGGCSAPSMKDQDAAMARLGKMKLRQLGAISFNEPNRAQLLIRHPNSTGMQMDQVTRHYIPAHFVRDIVVRYDDQTILTIEGDISMSEGPSMHFYFVPDGPGELAVEVTDTENNRFARSWPVPDDTGT